MYYNAVDLNCNQNTVTLLKLIDLMKGLVYFYLFTRQKVISGAAELL